MQLLRSFQKVPFSTLSTLTFKKVRMKVPTPVWVVIVKILLEQMFS